MSNEAPSGRLNLYEVVNYDRRESLVVLSADARASLMTRLNPPRPQPISHWHAKDVFAVNLLAAAMPAADAEEFLKVYLAKFRWQGWTMLTWRG
jgi:hypothetical protein